MRIRLLIAALAAAAIILPAAIASAQRDLREGRGGERRSDGPNRRDWTNTVVRTPAGGFRMGDPNAPVKLVEYVSLTCSHCAQFAADAGERLFLQHVRLGRVNVEYRNFPLNAYDLAAAFISRCASPREYFNMTHYLLGHQPEWMGRIDSITPAQRNELRTLTPVQAMARIVSLIGLDRIASRHGISSAQQRSCLADSAALTQIETMAQAGRSEHDVQGTPTFVINGRPVGSQSWATLEPMLRPR